MEQITRTECEAKLGHCWATAGSVAEVNEEKCRHCGAIRIQVWEVQGTN